MPLSPIVELQTLKPREYFTLVGNGRKEVFLYLGGSGAVGELSPCYDDKGTRTYFNRRERVRKLPKEEYPPFHFDNFERVE